MNETVSVALHAASAGVAVLGALLMAQRWSMAFAYRAGVVLFILMALIHGFNVIDATVTRLPAWAIQLSGGLVAAAFPTAWLYVRDLTSDVPRPLGKRDVWHFALALTFALHVAWAALLLSPASEESLWGLRPLDDAARWFGGIGVVLSVAWVVQVTYYSVRIAREVLRLPRRLRQVFSSTHGRDLIWLRLLGGVVLCHLPLAVLANLGLVEIPEMAFAVLALLLTFGLAGLAATQMPAFQLSPEAPDRIAPDAVDPLDYSAPNQPTGSLSQSKYARSLLDEERLALIARRIEAAFAQGDLHLDPNLSLAKLSARVGVSENHLSQTFTRQMGASFFDYVNGHRIEAAKAMLIDGGDSVVDIAIAVGFNARSAFYSAFRAAVGTTPAAYRKRQEDAGSISNSAKGA